MARGEFTSRGGSLAESPATGASFELRPAIIRGDAGFCAAAAGVATRAGTSLTLGATGGVAARVAEADARTPADTSIDVAAGSCARAVCDDDGTSACATGVETSCFAASTTGAIAGATAAEVSAMTGAACVASLSTTTFFAVFRTAFFGASAGASALSAPDVGVAVGVETAAALSVDGAESVTFTRVERTLAAGLPSDFDADATAVAVPPSELSPSADADAVPLADAPLVEPANHSRIVSASPADTAERWSLMFGTSSATHRATMSFELRPNSFAN